MVPLHLLPLQMVLRLQSTRDTRSTSTILKSSIFSSLPLPLSLLNLSIGVFLSSPSVLDTPEIVRFYPCLALHPRQRSCRKENSDSLVSGYSPFPFSPPPTPYLSGKKEHFARRLGELLVHRVFLLSRRVTVFCPSPPPDEKDEIRITELCNSLCSGPRHHPFVPKIFDALSDPLRRALIVICPSHKWLFPVSLRYLIYRDQVSLASF